MREEISWEGRKIPYELMYGIRTTLSIEVHPGPRVVVKAPRDAPLEKVRAKVERRAPWIWKKVVFFESFHPLTPPRRYVNGESHLYLGRSYRLRIVQAPRNEVKLIIPFLQVHCRESSAVESLVKGWYRKKAQQILPGMVNTWCEKFSKYQVKPSAVMIRAMKKSWGRCTPSGKIVLNSELIKAPKGCIDYVIVHELCHLLEPHHNKTFYSLLSTFMPNWRKWKIILENKISS
ncbi:MAG: M48 family metallopeptidase [Flavobacteriales bacterium]|nr:M48 family metallopeptidase [Flavobacteriales bacterium]